MTVRLTEGVDAGAVWHYGDPFREQKALVAGTAGVDLSHRPVFTDLGLRPAEVAERHHQPGLRRPRPRAADRRLHPRRPGPPHPRLRRAGRRRRRCGATPSPDASTPLLAWLRRMVFAARVEIADLGDEYALVLPPASGRRARSSSRARERRGDPRRARGPAPGRWRRCGSRPARRGSSSTPTRRRSPTSWPTPTRDLLGPAVHLRKGCYPGQETVARVYNLGRPPRRLTLLHLDGSVDRLPELGADVLLDGRRRRPDGHLRAPLRTRPDRARTAQADGTPTDAELPSTGSPRPRRCSSTPTPGCTGVPSRGWAGPERAPRRSLARPAGGARRSPSASGWAWPILVRPPLVVGQDAVTERGVVAGHAGRRDARTARAPSWSRRRRASPPKDMLVIIYPGGLVRPQAYEWLARALAVRGYADRDPGVLLRPRGHRHRPRRPP